MVVKVEVFDVGRRVLSSGFVRKEFRGIIVVFRFFGRGCLVREGLVC